MMDSPTGPTISWIPAGADTTTHAAHISNGYHQLNTRNMNGHHNVPRRGGNGGVVTGANNTGTGIANSIHQVPTSNQQQRSNARFLPDHIPIVTHNLNNSISNDTTSNNHRQRNGQPQQQQQQNQDRTSAVYRLDPLTISNGDLMGLYPTTPWVKQIYSSPPVLALHQEINDFYEFIKPIEEEEFMRNRVVSRIREIVLRLWPNAKVEIFGSFATKLYLPTSDIDLMIMGKWDTMPLHTLKNELIKADVANEDDIKVLDKASVPIVKVIDKETEVRVDISFNTSNGVNSANLIKEYMNKFPSLAKLVFVLKQFLYQRQLNEVFTGGISSYSLILMTISFLQLHPREDAHSDTSNLGVLLIEFFELYGRLFNYLKVGIRVKNGGSYVPKTEIQEQMDPGYRPSVLCIEDPLNPQNDIGKSSYGAMTVRKSFENAFLRLNQACGPMASTELSPNGHPSSILGHIIRVDDDVVRRREKIKRDFGGKMKDAISSSNNSSSSTSSGQQQPTTASSIMNNHQMSNTTTSTTSAPTTTTSNVVVSRR